MFEALSSTRHRTSDVGQRGNGMPFRRCWAKKMVLKTATLRDIRHDGQKKVLFTCIGSEGTEPIGLTFYLTDEI